MIKYLIIDKRVFYVQNIGIINNVNWIIIIYAILISFIREKLINKIRVTNNERNTLKYMNNFLIQIFFI